MYRVCVCFAQYAPPWLVVVVAAGSRLLLPAISHRWLVGCLLVDTVLSLMVLAGGVRYIHQSSPI